MCQDSAQQFIKKKLSTVLKPKYKLVCLLAIINSITSVLNIIVHLLLMTNLGFDIKNTEENFSTKIWDINSGCSVRDPSDILKGPTDIYSDNSIIRTSIYQTRIFPEGTKVASLTYWVSPTTAKASINIRETPSILLSRG